MANKKISDFQIYQKYMDLIFYSNDLVRKYPKSENFALVQEIKNVLYSGLRDVICGLKTYDTKAKLKYLNELDINLNLLKIHIRISHKYKYITTKNYTTWSEQLTNITNMLGGWINACLKK